MQDSSAVAAVTASGRLLVCRVLKKAPQPGQEPLRPLQKFSVPDCLEHLTAVPLKAEATAADSSAAADAEDEWFNTPELELQVRVCTRVAHVCPQDTSGIRGRFSLENMGTYLLPASTRNVHCTPILTLTKAIAPCSLK